MIQDTNLIQLPHAVDGLPSRHACSGEDCSRVFFEWSCSAVEQQLQEGCILEE